MSKLIATTLVAIVAVFLLSVPTAQACDGTIQCFKWGTFIQCYCRQEPQRPGPDWRRHREEHEAQMRELREWTDRETERLHQRRREREADERRKRDCENAAEDAFAKLLCHSL